MRRVSVTSLRAAWWANRAVAGVRRDLISDGLIGVGPVPLPRALPPETARIIGSVLRRRGATCLERALVWQAWHVAGGTPRDVVIGVSRAGGAFRAHAWLEGDPSAPEKDFEVVRRQPPAGEESRSQQGGPNGVLKAVAFCLLLDRRAGEVTGALAERGIKSVLLKGPAVAKWLYRDGSPRPYEDIDLLVAPDHVRVAEHVLSDHGFELAGTTFHAHTWIRQGDAAVVDLHWAIIGIGARPEDAWNVLTSDAEELWVGDGAVDVLSRPARALHVALHAVQHPWRERQSLIDLERALHQLPSDVWQRAAELGRRLDAEPALAAGLRLLPAGRKLSEELRLSERVSVDVVLREEKPATLTLALEHLASTPGVRSKLRFGLDRLFLSPEKLRAASPLARHGRVGLLMAYPARTLRMSAQAGPALAVWLRARRRARAR